MKSPRKVHLPETELMVNTGMGRACPLLVEGILGGRRSMPAPLIFDEVTRLP